MNLWRPSDGIPRVHDVDSWSPLKPQAWLRIDATKMVSWQAAKEKSSCQKKIKRQTISLNMSAAIRAIVFSNLLLSHQIECSSWPLFSSCSICFASCKIRARSWWFSGTSTAENRRSRTPIERPGVTRYSCTSSFVGPDWSKLKRTHAANLPSQLRETLKIPWWQWK